ncbi:Sulfur carrier protein adenylyltransferase ThiF [Rubellimicrobium mesophilum DSM 19309]|uniref:Molybdopterin-synthase adenylyltransferase n=1 Tax=Rubellimicrobium mesophilum DSM 19309 TaxID=442562 RepID=A0A017HTD4_9RHOB|nr:HesA/MoeB/ThiF family protein [Rubellimicrobium mesophilum]EYD77004.1 Sulfur carrier protein adenylyltransferase ThiF [Rubellimicrobium mesophilum DSM 19309]
MILVGAMAAAIWIVGWIMGTPRQARLLMVGILLTSVVALHVIVGEGHPLREATGRDPRLWIMLVAAVALAWGYFQVLGRVRAEANRRQVPPPEAPRPSGAFSTAELGRYARHITLREIGGPGQRALKEAKVLVVGAGGLGSPALLYLGAAGVGTIGIIDGDEVEASNLQRQVIHGEADLGRPKAQSAADAIVSLNPNVTVRTYSRRLTAENAGELVEGYDLILDGSDTFATRALVNEAAVRTGKPLIAAALSTWEGQISLYDPARGGPCYACLFPEAPAPGLAPSCAEAGVAGPLPGVLGTMMALEAVKHLTGAGETLRGRMLLYDGLHAEARVVQLEARAGCPVCGGRGLRA